MAFQLTPKIKIKKGDQILKSGKHWRLYSDVPMYGKEPIITPDQLGKLIDKKIVAIKKSETIRLTSDISFEAL